MKLPRQVRSTPFVMAGALCASAPLLARGAASTPPSQPPVVPFAAQVRLVMPAGVVAGMPVSIVQFASALTAVQALQETARVWAADRDTPVVSARLGPWQTVSRRRGDETLTLQIRDQPGGGSVGLLSHWGRPTEASESRLPLLREVLPHDARVLQTFGTGDHGTPALTVTALTELPADQAWQQIVERLGRQGFRDQGPTPGKPPVQTRAAFFRKGAAQLALTVDGRRKPAAIVLTLTGELR